MKQWLKCCQLLIDVTQTLLICAVSFVSAVGGVPWNILADSSHAIANVISEQGRCIYDCNEEKDVNVCASRYYHTCDKYKMCKTKTIPTFFQEC